VNNEAVEKARAIEPLDQKRHSINKLAGRSSQISTPAASIRLTPSEVEGLAHGGPPSCGTPYYVYLLRCADGTLYTGSTTDVEARERKHNAGLGAKYTAARRPVRMVYSEVHGSRSAAQQREAQLKRWTHAKKEALIAGNAALLKRL
jgi:putative endonuclease